MNMNVSLDDSDAVFVRNKVASGHFRSTDDVVRAALELMRRTEEEKLKWLREAWEAGIASGDAGEIDPEAFKVEARRRLAERKSRA